MKYLIVALILYCSAAIADPSSGESIDTPKGANDQAPAAVAAENVPPAQRNILPAVAKMAAIPSEFLSAPQYQPQPLQTEGLSPLYSLAPQ